MKRLLIKNGLLAAGDYASCGDVLCEGGIITRIGANLSADAAAGRDAAADGDAADGGDLEIIDAVGKIVMPGGVDVHTHLGLDTGSAVSSDDFYTGTVAAACGGTTTIIDHPA
ncbi:MAG: amidohydrolase family protein, partial [Treponema sp.]|nr:amidohydrolase family protein [Treponema sp.]